MWQLGAVLPMIKNPSSNTSASPTAQQRVLTSTWRDLRSIASQPSRAKARSDQVEAGATAEYGEQLATHPEAQRDPQPDDEKA